MEYMGSVQWLDLLVRPKLSCYDNVYTFARHLAASEPHDVHQNVLDELLLSAALSPWWSIPLDSEYCSTVLATDASTTFGFGGSVADLPLDEVRALSRLRSQVGDAVVLNPEDARSTDGARIGRRHKLGIDKGKFRTAFSVRATRQEHINVLETKALNMGLRWLLRSTARHGKRVVMLLDSKVAIGGAAKGRSSSQVLLAALRQTAALTLAGELQVVYVFVRSADNPADMPSRGQCRPRRRTLKEMNLDRLCRQLHRKRGAVDRLRLRGHFDFLTKR